MKPEPAVQPPFPAVKNQRRFPVLWIGAMFCLMLINSGCTFSYHVKPDPKGPDARSYALIEQQLKHKEDGLQDSRSLIRANESGFTYSESLGIYDCRRKTYLSKLITCKWENVKDIKVHTGVPLLFFGGLIDPTAGSSVKLTFYDRKYDGSTLELSAYGAGWFIPFWIFSTHWGKAHQTAVAFQTIVDSHKQNAGTTTLKNP